MLRQRLLVVAVLLPIGVAAIIFGSWVYLALIGVILVLAASEYVNVFRTGGFKPSGFVVVSGVVALHVVRHWQGTAWDAPLLVGLCLLAMAVHVIEFEKGEKQSAIDFTITLTGALYLGILGSYFVLVRDLPDGMWWTFIILPAIWWGDTGAYFIGSWIGKHKFAPRLSPKKTWEGYFGGIVFATLGTPLLVKLYYGLGLTPAHGATLGNAALLGLVLGVFATLGDLGISMLKRQFGMKDTGVVLPGHGGMLDRIDSWLWGLPIGYYLVMWLFI